MSSRSEHICDYLNNEKYRIAEVRTREGRSEKSGGILSNLHVWNRIRRCRNSERIIHHIWVLLFAQSSAAEPEEAQRIEGRAWERMKMNVPPVWSHNFSAIILILTYSPTLGYIRSATLTQKPYKSGNPRGRRRTTRATMSAYWRLTPVYVCTARLLYIPREHIHKAQRYKWHCNLMHRNGILCIQHFPFASSPFPALHFWAIILPRYEQFFLRTLPTRRSSAAERAFRYKLFLFFETISGCDSFTFHYFLYISISSFLSFRALRRSNCRRPRANVPHPRSHSRTKSLFDLNFVLLKITIPFFQCSSTSSFSCICCLLSSERWRRPMSRECFTRKYSIRIETSYSIVCILCLCSRNAKI